jgi:hypothetical protein
VAPLLHDEKRGEAGGRLPSTQPAPSKTGDRHCAGSFSSWHEQDPSVHLSGFDLAVRLGGFFEREDVGMKVDEACGDGFERAFGGAAG